jgi:hypothetical protein
MNTHYMKALVDVGAGCLLCLMAAGAPGWLSAQQDCEDLLKS